MVMVFKRKDEDAAMEERMIELEDMRSDMEILITSMLTRCTKNYRHDIAPTGMLLYPFAVVISGANAYVDKGKKYLMK